MLAAHALRAEAFGGGNCSGSIDIATAQTRHGCRQDFDTETFIAFYPTNRQPDFGNYEDISPAVKCGSSGPSGNPPGVVGPGMAVRRLTPTECEALQGFPRGYTAINHRGKPAADGPRYKALGNSMAVPVLRWIGRRIRETAQPKETSCI
jgi:site-specific DNA-cytosine methylase